MPTQPTDWEFSLMKLTFKKFDVSDLAVRSVSLAVMLAQKAPVPPLIPFASEMHQGVFWGLIIGNVSLAELCGKQPRLCC